MTTITRTVYGAAIQTAQYFGKQHQIVENTTLNEKFGIYPSARPNQGEQHKAQYLVIGDKGHTGTLGAGGRFRTKDIKHRRTDAACFNHIPFVIRDIDNDLSIEERENYGLRVVTTIDNAVKVLYYAKLMDLDASVVNMQKTNKSTKETVPFTPTSNELNPEVPEDFEATNESITSSLVLPIEFTANDIEELRNVALVLYGDEDEAIISEFGIVSAVRRTVTGQSAGNNTINYNELISAQIVLHITSYYSAEQNNDGFRLALDGGVGEALSVMS